MVHVCRFMKILQTLSTIQPMQTTRPGQCHDSSPRRDVTCPVQKGCHGTSMEVRWASKQAHAETVEYVQTTSGAKTEKGIEEIQEANKRRNQLRKMQQTAATQTRGNTTISQQGQTWEGGPEAGNWSSSHKKHRQQRTIDNLDMCKRVTTKNSVEKQKNYLSTTSFVLWSSSWTCTKRKSV